MRQTGLVAGLGLCAFCSLVFAARLWTWVLDFDPAFVFDRPPSSSPTGPPLSRGVTLLLVDGLRLDASRKMPTLNALRRVGADFEGHVGTPSFSRPGRATIGTGAPPAVHGVTTNRQARPSHLDNLIRRVGAMGGTCRVAGSRIWSGLFGDDISHCGVYRLGESKEGPGAFVRQVPAVRVAQSESLAFVLLRPATLRVVDIVSTDFAAHEFGGTSSEYADEVARTDKDLSELVGRLDLTTETLVVTSDHGHRDAGGHGGREPEVLAIPIVMVGAGIRPSTSGRANQADIAPTIAVLLGAALPSGASGRPLDSVLLGDDLWRAEVARISTAQREGFETAIARRLGVSEGESGGTDFEDLIHAYRDREMSRRVPMAIALGLIGFTAAVLTIYSARPRFLGVAVGAAAFTAALIGPVRWLAPPLTFSAINYDELLIPFFVRIMALLAAGTVVGVGAGLLCDRLQKDHDGTGVAGALAGAIGLLASLGLVIATIAAWLHHGLLLPLSIPGPDRMVEAYAFTLSVMSVSLTTLVLMAILGFVRFRRA